MLPQLYLKEQGASTFVISLATTLLWLGILVGSAFWGELCDRVSTRSVLVGALAGGFLSLGVLAFLLPPLLFLAACFFCALIAIGAVPATMSMISSRSCVSHRGRALSTIGFSRSFGMAAGGILAGVLLATTGFRWTFLLLGCPFLLGLLFVFSLPRQQEHDIPLKRTSFSFLGVGRLRGLYLGVTLNQMGLLGSASLVFVHMSNIGITEGIMGVLAALAPTTAMLTMLLSGHLADHVGRKKVFVAGFGLIVLSPVVFAFSCNAPMMAVGFVIMGLSFGPFFVGSTAHIGDLTPANRQGVMLGFFESSRAIGGVLGPLVAGAITPLIGFKAMFLVMATVSLLGFGSVLLWTD